MVTYPSARKDIFKAIADPHRRAIINLLARKKLTLNGIAENFSVSRPAVSKHIKILSECGLVTIERQGRERYCSLRPDKLTEVSEWIEKSRRLWTARLDALEKYLVELETNDKKKG